MNLFGKRTRDHIEVQFVDLATGKMFAQSTMPVGQLPQSFEASTTLHLTDGDWCVVEARPMTAFEFVRSGKLTLVLSKVVTGSFDLSTFLFSLPTITNDALPPIAPGTSKLGLEHIEVHEDDWRQIEWLPATAADLVEAELSLINALRTNHWNGTGFTKCHVRKGIPTLSSGPAISLDEFRAAIPFDARWLSGFTYQGVAGIVTQSFAVRLRSSIELFGLASDVQVYSVCFTVSQSIDGFAADVEALAEFAARRELLLVDWCRGTAVRPTSVDYMGYFGTD